MGGGGKLYPRTVQKLPGRDYNTLKMTVGNSRGRLYPRTGAISSGKGGGGGGTPTLGEAIPCDTSL